MHGRIVEVRVAAGDRVEEGALLLVLEAMKMQNEIRASRSGVIERVQAQPGQTVEGGAFLLSIRSENI
jgi:biotin carboxyl carrier protein